MTCNTGKACSTVDPIQIYLGGLNSHPYYQSINNVEWYDKNLTFCLGNNAPPIIKIIMIHLVGID